MNKKQWVVYLVRCSDESLYCGITNNLKNRLAMNVKKELQSVKRELGALSKKIEKLIIAAGKGVYVKVVLTAPI
ncbi:GIY-YIG nuclease family protein [Thermodesulfobacteriota bacterium]